MLNVSATQELAKRLEQKAAEVTALEKEVAELKTMVKQLASESKRTKLAGDPTTPNLPSGTGESNAKPLTTASLDH
jgi:hypothetical protein